MKKKTDLNFFSFSACIFPNGFKLGLAVWVDSGIHISVGLGFWVWDFGVALG